MAGKQSRKLFQKQVTSQSTIDGIKNVDGRDRQIADVRKGNLNDNAISRRVITQGAVGFDEVGLREIGGNRIFVDGVGREHIQGGAVSPNELDRDYVTPSEGDDRYASRGHSHDFPDQTGNALEDAFRHRHSISSTTFIQQPLGERMRMLNDRLDLEELVARKVLGRTVSVVVRNLLNVLTLLMDYRGLNAYQRERALQDPSLAGWADAYKRTYGVDEYAEEARDEFMPHVHGVRMDPYTGIAQTEPRLEPRLEEGE